MFWNLSNLAQAWLSTSKSSNWSEDSDVAPTGAVISIELPVGEHAVTLVVNDGIEDSEPDEAIITVLPTIEANLKFTPQSLNCKSNGNWIKVHIILPQEFLPEDVNTNIPAIVFSLGTEAEYMNVFINDEGLVEIEAAFDRSAFCEALADNGSVEIEVVGSFDTGQYFYGSDAITVKNIIEENP